MDEPDQGPSNPVSSVPNRTEAESALRTHNAEIKKRIVAAQLLCGNASIITDNNLREQVVKLLSDLHHLAESNDKVLSHTSLVHHELKMVRDIWNIIRYRLSAFQRDTIKELPESPHKLLLKQILQSVLDACPIPDKQRSDITNTSTINLQGLRTEGSLTAVAVEEVEKDPTYFREKERQQQERLAARKNEILTSGSWHEPLSNADAFVDRKNLTSKLQSHFQTGAQPDESSSNESSTRTVILNTQGMGGVGKTQLAIDYLHKHRDRYPFRIWFNAANLAAEYRQFALDMSIIHPDEKIGAEDIRNRVKRWLETNPGWLLIYDDSTDLDELQFYRPASGGHVLITTRNAVTPPWLVKQGCNIYVDVMTPSEAIALLEKMMGCKDEHSAELTKVLGYLPLALAQAGAYIRQNPECHSVADYLKLYKEKQAELLAANHLDPEDLDQPAATVAVTWNISIKAIQESKESGINAINLLNFCAYLASTIEDRLILASLGIQPNAKGRLQLNQIKKVLRQYSMAEIKQPETLNLHQLVQAVIKEQQGEEQWQWLEEAADVVNEDYTTDRENVEDYQKVSLAPHLKELRKHLEKALAKSEKAGDEVSVALIKRELAAILMNSGLVEGNLCNYEERKHLLEAALVIFKAVHDETHPEVAMTMNNLGLAYGELGDYGEQKRLLEAALAIEKKVYGDQHPAVAATLMNLGLACGRLGDFGKKKRLLEAALAIQRQVYGETHPEVALTLNNLGSACGSLEDYGEQKRLYEAALAIDRKVYGETHPKVAATMGNLGSVCGELGDHYEEKRLLEAALVIFKAVHGETHPDVAKAMGYLGSACGSLGDYGKKKRLLEAALAIQKKVYGETHPDVATTLMNLGLACGSLGGYGEQKRLLEAALVIRKKVFGETHPEVAITLAILEKAHLPHAKAVAVLQRQYLQKLLYADTRTRAQYFLSMAHQCVVVGNAIQAIQHYESYLEHVSGTASTDVYRNLACCYHVEGDLEKAEYYFTLALKKAPNSATYCEYGQFLYLGSRHKPAIMLLRKAIDMQADGQTLSYNEHAMIEMNLQREVGQRGEVTFNAGLLSRYLLIKSYCALAQADGKQVTSTHSSAKSTLPATADFSLQVEKQLIALKAIVSQQSDPLAHRLLGYAYQAMGGKKAAAEWFNKAEQLTSLYTPETQQAISRVLTQFFVEHTSAEAQPINDDSAGPPPLEDDDDLELPVVSDFLSSGTGAQSIEARIATFKSQAGNLIDCYREYIVTTRVSDQDIQIGFSTELPFLSEDMQQETLKEFKGYLVTALGNQGLSYEITGNRLVITAVSPEKADAAVNFLRAANCWLASNANAEKETAKFSANA